MMETPGTSTAQAFGRDQYLLEMKSLLGSSKLEGTIDSHRLEQCYPSIYLPPVVSVELGRNSYPHKLLLEFASMFDQLW